MSSNNEVRGDEEGKDKDHYLLEYATMLDELDKAQQPFREQKIALRGNFIENGWLTKEECSMVLKAYRLNKNNIDMDQLRQVFDVIAESSE
jgi:hypothetical protein